MPERVNDGVDRRRDLWHIARRLSGQSLAYALASAVGPLTGVLLLPVYTRYLTPEDFGLIALFELLSLVFATVFSLGLTAMIPFYYVDHPAGAARRRGIGTVVVAVTLLNLILAGVVVAAGATPIGILLPSVPFWPYVPILALTALFEPYWVIAGSIYQIQEQASRFSVWSTARLLMAISLKLWFVVVLGEGVYGFLISSLIAAIVTAAAVVPLLAREMQLAMDPVVLRRALIVGGPTVPNNLFSYGFRVLDRVILERFVGHGEIGLYYLALRLADLMRLASDVFVNAWRPVFFKEAAHVDFVTDIVPAVIRLASVLIIGAGLGLSLFSREILAVLATPAYADAARFVPFLAGAMVVKGLYSFPYLAVWYRKKTFWVPLLTAVTMAFSVAANLLLAPGEGALGAAGVQLMSYLVLFAGMWALARREFRLPYPWKTIAAAAMAAAVASGVGVMLPATAAGVAGKVGLLAVYGVVVGASGGIRANELKMLVEAPPPPSSSVVIETP